MARRKIEKPTKSMRDAAWRALHQIVADPDAGDTARVSAARAIVKDDLDAAEAAEAAAGPPAVLCIPTNGRDPELTPLGITRNDGCWTIFYDGGTEAGAADLKRYRAQVAAELAAAYPPPPLALPAPIKLTEAERKRISRAKIAAAKAAAAEIAA
jgi:hypothetical protein